MAKVCVSVSQLLSIKNVGMLCCLVIIFCQTVNAVDESPAVEWDRTYGPIQGQDVISTEDSGYVVVGTTGDWVDARGGGDWTNRATLLIKLDALGEVVWRKNYTRIYPQSISLTSDGGYILTTSLDATLVKFDSLGNMLWNKTYAAIDDPWSVIQTRDGGFVIVGGGNHPISGMAGKLVKIDLEGNLQWNKTYGETNDNGILRSVIETDDGYVLAGSTHDDVWLVKTDSNGDMMWEKSYGGQKSDGCMAAVRATDGGYLLVGYTYSFGAGDYDSFVVKTDSWGNRLWQKTYGGSGSDGFGSIIRAMDGGYVLTGNVNSSDNDRASVVVKLSVSGELEWEKTYPGVDKLQSVDLAVDGGYILVGNKGYSLDIDSEVWVVKLAPDSCAQAGVFPVDDVIVVALIVATIGTVIAVGVFLYRKSMDK